MERFINRNCFALTGLDTCSALEKTQCENCKFCKSKAQVERERKAAISRLKKLHGGSYYLQKYHLEESQATK
ncbi:hypothetical protein ACTQ3L_10520 [Oscillospiraceae bacterium LCP25S3_E4]